MQQNTTIFEYEFLEAWKGGVNLLEPLYFPVEEAGAYIPKPTLVIPRIDDIKHNRNNSYRRHVGVALTAIALGGMAGPLSPFARMEAAYVTRSLKQKVETTVIAQPKALPPAAPKVFNPLVTEDGASIDPVSREFGLIVPKVGINAAVIPAVNPANPGVYLEELKKGVAHASTSYFPDEDGTVYLFSHSTSYDWFVRDLNAVFYLLKNIETDDYVVLFYKNKRYTYKITDKKIVNPNEISYLVPQPGPKRLILQTCWPPGSTTKRLLIFADLIEEQAEGV